MSFIFRCAAALLLTAIGLAGSGAHAATYPDKPVRVIVPFAPGGPNDVIARLVAQKLGALWKQSVVVENRGGAGGVVGTLQVIHAAPDGYTLLWNGTNIVVAPSLYDNANYDPVKDLVSVVHAATVPFLVMVDAKSDMQTPADLVRHIKQLAGKANQGSSGNGSTDHLLGIMFAKDANVSFVHVPYKGNALALNDLAAGRLDFVFSAAIQSALPLVEAGRLRIIGVTSQKRLAAMPNIPTLAESVSPDLVASTWSGLFAPVGTPPDVVKAINQAVNTVLKDRGLLKALKDQSAEPGGGDAKSFASFVSQERQRWTGVVQAMGDAAKPK